MSPVANQFPGGLTASQHGKPQNGGRKPRLCFRWQSPLRLRILVGASSVVTPLRRTSWRQKGDSKLGRDIGVLQNMTSLAQVWLH
ncbi:hypothetical protein PIB30_027566 [Stylosanthes scabra]|uniref:Uncharacterized protein n=1 Tax=Stylosanthes scabra TaxID=79078 RepID=A0ABU6WAD1_9FABA|nr:hypothetical protein [Stylosanthes scabra]